MHKDSSSKNCRRRAGLLRRMASGKGFGKSPNKGGADGGDGGGKQQKQEQQQKQQQRDAGTGAQVCIPWQCQPAHRNTYAQSALISLLTA